MDLFLCRTLLPMDYSHLIKYFVSCLSSFSPFDFTQNCLCLLPVLVIEFFFTLCFIPDHMGKVVTLLAHPPSVCHQLCLWVQSQQAEVQGKATKASGNKHRGSLVIRNTCTGQCLCFVVMSRTLSYYILYTPTTKQHLPMARHTMYSKFLEVLLPPPLKHELGWRTHVKEI